MEYWIEAERAAAHADMASFERVEWKTPARFADLEYCGHVEKQRGRVVSLQPSPAQPR
jgi:hypothetical protein